MATGYFSAGHCWPTTAEALDAHYLSKPPSLSSATNGSGVYTEAILHTYKTSGLWFYQRVSCNGSTCSTNTYSAWTPTFPSCTISAVDDPVESFADGNVLGWGVVAAMVAAWAIVQLRRGLFT